MRANRWVVPVTIDVPVDADSAEVRMALDMMIGEAIANCLDYAQGAVNADVKEGAKRMLSFDFNVGAADLVRAAFDVTVEVDFAEYCGDAEDGVYYQAFEDDAGQWWLSAIVDCASHGFVDTLIDGDGPYNNEADALRAGRFIAVDWCLDNGIDAWEDD